MFGGAKPFSFFKIVGCAKDCWRIENETNNGRFSNPFSFLHHYIETFWRRQVSDHLQRQKKNKTKQKTFTTPANLFEKRKFFLFLFFCLEFSSISIWVCLHSERKRIIYLGYHMSISLLFANAIMGHDSFPLYK